MENIKKFINTPLNRTQYFLSALVLVLFGILFSHLLVIINAPGIYLSGNNPIWQFPLLTIVYTTIGKTLSYKRLLDFTTRQKALFVLSISILLSIFQYYIAYFIGFAHLKDYAAISTLFGIVSICEAIYIIALLFIRGNSIKSQK